MIKRRALLLATPFAFLAACAKAETAASQPDLKISQGSVLSGLTDGGANIAWLSLRGTMRPNGQEGAAQPATLLRAIRQIRGQPDANGKVGISVMMFDIWTLEGATPVAGPSTTKTLRIYEEGDDEVWLERELIHPALAGGVESSRLSRLKANVIAISDAQIWLLSGGLVPQPTLSPEARTLFDAWSTL